MNICQTLLAHSERSALLIKCLLFHPVVPCIKNYRLIVDPAEPEGKLSFAFGKQLKYIGAVASQNVAILAKQSWSWENSVYSWLVSDPVCALAYLPKFYSRDFLGTFWRAILFFRQEVQIARYIDATTKSLT